MIVAPLTLDPCDGAASIWEQPPLLLGGLCLDSARSALSPFISSETGWDAYHRVECQLGEDENHITFGGWRCEFIATFQNGGLATLHWRLWPPKGKYWPAGQETNDDQMWVLRRTLQIQLSRPFDARFEHFDWGMVGCLPDLHTNDPNVQVRYRTADETG